MWELWIGTTNNKGFLRRKSAEAVDSALYTDYVDTTTAFRVGN